jgi:serine/threonine-protein kinase/endoribonuclease IRE1
MPRRRPPREGLGVNNLIIFAVAILFLSCQVEAQQQQRPAVLQRHESPHEDPDALHRLEATTIRPQIETPHISERRKSTISINNNNKRINHDASAIATLAPAGYPAVSAPPARRSPTGGLTSLHIARSLEDWEVEDFVLLATVDGGLHARDRKTGKPIWNFNLNDPMVQTTFHRRDRSATQNGSNAQDFYTPSSIDDYIWIVEPSRDGSLYIYRPGGPDPGLIHTGLTMKKLVEELSPFADEDPAVTYTGSKQTQMMVIDARDGRILKHFGGPGPNVVKSSCLNPTGVLNMESGECSSSTFTIGRTEYKVDIGGMDGREIATLKFFEWTPNNYDLDLLEKYHTTLDNKYIYTSHDGGVIGFDHERSNTNEPGRLFKHKFESPVARVFDVAKPWGSEDNDANLILLPQPIPPIHMEDEVSRDRRASSIFLNHTVDGSWYAMSGTFYPMAVQGIGPARCEQQDWKEYGPSWDTLDDSEISRALVGLHSIDRGASERLLTINAPAPGDNRSENASTDHAPALRDDPSFLERIQLLPGIAVNSLLEFIKNPMLIILLIAVLGSNQRQLRTWVGRFGKNHTKLIESPVTADMPEAGPILPAEKTVKIPAVDGTADTPVVKIVEVHPTKGETHKEDGDPEDDNADWQKVSRKDSLDAPSLEDPAATPKKRARGRRGGVKHKKGNKERTASTDGSQDLKKVRDRAASVDASQAPNPPPTVDDAVRDAQKLGEQKQTLEPDTMTISNNPADISGPIIKIGALTVNTEKLIGTGSNGTMVFEGDFDGRAVAVKRMLIQFFDIASQETKLLRESDDHPNGELNISLLLNLC